MKGGGPGGVDHFFFFYTMLTSTQQLRFSRVSSKGVMQQKQGEMQGMLEKRTKIEDRAWRDSGSMYNRGQSEQSSC